MPQTDPFLQFGFRVGALLSIGSKGFSYNLSGSIGMQHMTQNFEGVFFAGGNFYGGNQLGTGPGQRTEFDLMSGLYLSAGNGNAKAHNFNLINYNMLSPFTNTFDTSFSYGQIWNYNSTINREVIPNPGNRIQRSAVIGLRGGKMFSLTTANDTGRIGGDGGDRGHTGQVTFNVGGVEFGYQNFTGSYNRDQEDTVRYADVYAQTPYQTSLNKSLYYVRYFDLEHINAVVELGPSDGFVQRVVHSVTGTGLFEYLGRNDFNFGAAVKGEIIERL